MRKYLLSRFDSLDEAVLNNGFSEEFYAYCDHS